MSAPIPPAARMNNSRRDFLVVSALWLAAGSLPATAAETPTLQLIARDGRFQPETLEVPAGKRFRLAIRNEGPAPVEFEMRSPFREKLLGPGGRSFLVFAPLVPGTYPFCDELHRDTGKGRIIAR
jgi:hypothetical protein